MDYVGQVRNGVVIFDGDHRPPEGAVVRVEPIAPEERPDQGGADGMAATRSWLLALASEARAIEPRLPSDLAEHHDHYAHGKPRL